MTTRSRRIHEEIRNLLDYLLAAEIALFTNGVRDDGYVVSWRSSDAHSPLLVQKGAATASLYRSWLENGAYSAVLFDGSLIQLTYDVRGDAVVGHRLAYVPCPFDVDQALLESDPLLDVIHLYATGETKDVVLATAVRFDYDPINARENHPAAHLTLNASHCRIACLGPLRLGHFVEFVFANFYPWLWDVHPYLRNLSRKTIEGSTLTSGQGERIHLAWREPSRA